MLLNPFSVDPLGTGRDLVAAVTVWILLLMGAMSWLVLVAKSIVQWRFSLSMKKERRVIHDAGFVQADIERLSAVGPLHWIALCGRRAAESYGLGTLSQHIALNLWIANATQCSVADMKRRMQRGTSLLASVASTAPFVGLFGTVWIMCQVLSKTEMHGIADVDQLAPRIAAGLVLTSLGLAVAVPARTGFNLLSGRQALALAELRQFSSEVHMAMLAGKRSGVA